MSDPLRTDTTRATDAAPDADRDAKIEQLLLTGLDHYFGGQYEQAINVWSRALFLDRSHARARAYIERARSALAERQRESEELLQKGLAAFKRGEGDEARRLLRSAINRGAPSDEALAVLERLDRLDPGTTPGSVGPSARPRTPPRPIESPRRIRFGTAVAAALVIAIAAGGVLLSRMSPTSWRALLTLPMLTSPPPVAVAAPSTERGLPVLRRGETALARASTFASTGRLRDALAALDGVRPTDPQKAAADQLRADIQRQLLSVAASTDAPGTRTQP
jgi:tetratricopeptide (TPR) repeat protein